MQQWLQHGAAWVVFALDLAVTWGVIVLARRVLKSILGRLFSRTSANLDERLVQAAATPVRLMILAIGFNLALDALKARLPALAGSVEFGWADKVMGALVILAITAMVDALLKSGLDWYLHEVAAVNRATWDEELRPIVRRLLGLLLYFIAISIILKNFGQDITALVTTAGVASLAVALAAQETLSNMLGGFVILVDRPFKVGDVIELADGKQAEVIDIGLRSTRIRLADGNLMVAPNKDMAGSRVITVCGSNQRTAIRQTITVTFDTDVERTKAILLAAVTEHPEVLKEPAPGVWFTRFGESGLELQIACWVESGGVRPRVTDDLNVRILQELRAASILLAHPRQDVFIHRQESAE